MGLINGLKWEHEIYDDDFDSKDEFIKEFDRIIDDLESRKDDIYKLKDLDETDWNNNKARDDFDEIVEDAIDDLKKTIEEIKDLKRGVR